MSRLPTPGGDAGDWGGILNDYLEVEHNSDGTLKLRSDGTLDSFYTKPGTGIPKADLSSAVQTSLDLGNSAVQSVNGQTGGSVTLASSDVGAVALVVHGATAGTARPSGATQVEWHGTVTPTNAAVNDMWYDRSKDLWRRCSSISPLTFLATSNGAYESGTLANLPANGARADGYTYFATDQNGGTMYQMIAGVWVQVAAGVNTAAGQIIAGPVQITSQCDVRAFGTTMTDVNSMTLSVPASSRPVMLRAFFQGVINMGASSSGTTNAIWVVIADTANNNLTLSSLSVVSTGAQIGQSSTIGIEYYLPAPVSAATYKIRARMAGTASPVSALLNPSYGLVAGAANYFYAQAL